eukprot:gene16471-7887_t
MSNSTDNKTRLVNNQLYDETLSVHDDEEIASTFTPSPRPARIKGPNQNSTEMGDLVSDDEFDHDNLVETSAPQKAVNFMLDFNCRYTPQNIELEHKLRPFIPDYIPSVGDIDAFLKVTRPENKVEVLGLQVLDEPCAKQSDPTVLDLQLRSISKQTTAKQMVVRSIDDAEKNPKAVDTWIESISDLHKQKPAQNVHYSKTMPDVEGLMQEWPHDFEEMLKTVGLPTAELECDLQQYIDIVCGILDIPVHKSRVQSLHVLFTLYSEFKNSQHFNQLARDNLLSNKLKGNRGAANESEDFQSMTFE